MSNLSYRVSTFREAGLEAKWSKTGRGAPIIVARNPDSELEHRKTRWWVIDRRMFDDMKKDGIKMAFDNHTALGNYFSISV